mgnify:CR=1 FL=1
MITRVGDNNLLNDKQYELISNAIENHNKKKVVDIVDDESIALLLKKQLKVQGYKCQINKIGNKYKVIAILPEMIKFDDALKTQGFKKLAWGKYFFQRESALGLFKGDFDDGSVWKVITSENGEEYLVKEVCDDDEEKVIRTKTAKTNNTNIVDDENVKTVISILYDIDKCNNAFVDDLLGSNIKSEIHSFLNKKLTNLISNSLQKNHFIQSPEYISDVNEIVKTAINGKSINSMAKLNELIHKYTNDMTAITNKYKIKKIFD